MLPQLSSVRDAERGTTTPEDEIKITSEMRLAGIYILAERHGVVSRFVAEEIVEEVFQAMMCAAQNGVFLPPNGDDSNTE